MEESYIKVLKDFLVITCAQAQDAKNPNIIKDIKSLKLLYPSGLGCAVDMQHTIECVISILRLREVKTGGQEGNSLASKELMDLTL